MPTVTHQIAEERSLALHREVARRLREDPELLEMARCRVNQWLESGSVSRRWAEAWREVLSGSLEGVIEVITGTSQRARDLRQATPFAGAIDPRARWEILRGMSGQAKSA